jgi:hypothetical protein
MCFRYSPTQAVCVGHCQMRDELESHRNACNIEFCLFIPPSESCQFSLLRIRIIASNEKEHHFSFIFSQLGGKGLANQNA